MDNKNDDLKMNKKLNKTRAKQLQDLIDNIYKRTNYTDNKDDVYLDTVKKNMDDSLNGLLDKSKIRSGDSNISSLYSRVLSKNGEDMDREIQHTLQDESMLADVMDLYSQNVIIRDQDREIDLVCKYMPKLEQALDIKVDHIFSADHFKKDALILTVLNNKNKLDNGTTTNDKETEHKLEDFKLKYDLEKFSRKMVKNTLKYGEQYVYVVPFSKALSKLLLKKNGYSSGMVHESIESLNEETINNIVKDNSEYMDIVYPLNEDVRSEYFMNDDLYVDKNSNDDSYKYYESKSNKSYNNDLDVSELKIELNETGVIPSIVTEQLNMMRILSENKALEEASLDLFNGQAKNSDILKGIDKEYKKFIGNSLKGPQSIYADGFVDKNNIKKENIDVPGCVVEILEHTMIKPVYIRNVALGYYYIETDTELDANEQTTFSSTLGGLRPKRSQKDRQNATTQNMDNSTLMRIAKQLSKRIDSKFINSNQDLTKEIYTILKYNADHGNGKVTKIRVSFIPPEEIYHITFKKNDKTHRGVSDLDKALFPAKLYSCLYISNTIALLTRGYDKRVYHVRQAVDTNITQVLLNVVNQIKQSNFNLRQIENMNNILNITGRFNDLVVPQNANGESPVNFEVMPGQNIDIKTDFMNQLEEMAVNETGLSIDMINSRLQENTATHLTMSNSRFLLKIVALQLDLSKMLSKLFTSIYGYEYQSDDTVQVTLIPPVMSNFTNSSQILAMVNELVTSIDTMQMGYEQDEVLRTIYRGELFKFYLKDTLPIEEFEKIEQNARVKYSVLKKQEDQNQNTPQQF